MFFSDTSSFSGPGTWWASRIPSQRSATLPSRSALLHYLTQDPTSRALACLTWWWGCSTTLRIRSWAWGRVSLFFITFIISFHFIYITFLQNILINFCVKLSCDSQSKQASMWSHIRTETCQLHRQNYERRSNLLVPPHIFPLTTQGSVWSWSFVSSLLHSSFYSTLFSVFHILLSRWDAPVWPESCGPALWTNSSFRKERRPVWRLTRMESEWIIEEDGSCISTLQNNGSNQGEQQ